MDRFALAALLILALVAPTTVGQVEEVKRGSKTIQVYQDAETNKIQAVVPSETGWSHNLPPFQNAPTAYFKVLQGTRDVEIFFHRMQVPPQQADPKAYIAQVATNLKQNWHDFSEESTDKIFSGRRVASDRPVPFFRTGEKGHVYCYSGLRLFRKADAQGNPTDEIVPDPNGKRMYNQLWVVPRTIGGATYFYLWTVMVPETSLDRKDNLNKPTLQGLADLMNSIRFLR